MALLKRTKTGCKDGDHYRTKDDFWIIIDKQDKDKGECQDDKANVESGDDLDDGINQLPRNEHYDEDTKSI